MALLPLLWAAAGPMRAQDAAPGWHVGRVVKGTSASWWWAVVDDGLAPAVSVDQGVAWAHCPAPAYEPQTCTIVAQGPWTVLIVDGATLWERGRVALPGVSGGL